MVVFLLTYGDPCVRSIIQLFMWRFGSRMAMCGGICTCPKTGVLRSDADQLTGGSRVSLLASAIIYGNSLATSQTHYPSCDQYIAFKKAQVIAGSTNGPGPVPSIIVTDLQEAGCLSVAASRTRPGPPTDVLVLFGNGTATVSWMPPLDDGGLPILSYSVTIIPPITSGLGPLLVTSGTTVIVALQSPLVITGLTNGTSYTITVGATSAIGTSSRITAGLAPGSPATPVGPPMPPTNVASDASNASVLVSWSPPVNNGGSPITGYIVTTIPGQATTSVPGTSTSVLITGLTNGLTYLFSVTSVTAIGSSSQAFSNPSIPGQQPGPPTNVIAVGSQSQITVTWTPPLNNGGSPIINYTVTRFPDLVTRTGLSPMIFTDVSNGSPYSFSVVSRNSVGISVPSAVSNTVIPGSVPGAPTSVFGTAGDSQVTVFWTAPVNTGGIPIVSYTVISTPESVTVTSTGTSVVVPGLRNTIAYTFTVIAVNAIGSSVASLPSAPVTPAGQPDPPTGVYAVAGQSSATISWTPPLNIQGSAITGYKVVSSPGDISANVGALVTTATLSGLVAGTSYGFYVTAFNGVGVSNLSTVSNSVIPFDLPTAPTAVSAVGGDSSAIVTWSGANDNGSTIISYTVTSAPGALIRTGFSPLNFQGLTNGTSYTFTVKTQNTVGLSPTSSPVSNAVTPIGPPGTPFNVVAVPADMQATVTWDASGSGGSLLPSSYVVSAYTVSIAYDASGDPYYVNATIPFTSQTVSSITPVTFTGLTNGSTYAFTVTTINGVRSSIASIYSQPVTPGRVPDVPTFFSITYNYSLPDRAYIIWSMGPNTSGFPITIFTIIAYPGGIQFVINAESSYVPLYQLYEAPLYGLTYGVTYSFTIAATNAVGSSAPSDISGSVIAGRVPPAVPASYVTPDVARVFLSWVAPVEIVGVPIQSYFIQSLPGALIPSYYTVYNPITQTYQYAQHPTADLSFNPVTQFVSGIPPTTLNAIFPDLSSGIPNDRPLQNGRNYEFRVYSQGNLGSIQGTSEYMTTSPTVPRDGPDPPVIVSVVVNYNLATVYWNFSANNGSDIISYTVTVTALSFYDNQTGTTLQPAVTQTVPVYYNNLTVVLTNYNTFYKVTMVSTNAIGTSAVSNIYNFFTGIFPKPSLGPPAAPFPMVDLSANLIPNTPNASLLVTWSSVYSFPPVQSYTVIVNPGSIVTTVYGFNSTSLQVLGLSFNTTYTISAYPTNSVGDGDTIVVLTNTGPGPIPVSVSIPPVPTYTIPDTPTSVVASSTASSSYVGAGIIVPISTSSTSGAIVTTTFRAGRVTLSFTEPNNGGSPIIGYTVVQNYPSLSYTSVSTDVSGSTTPITVNAPLGISGEYYVLARNALGLSLRPIVPSNTISNVYSIPADPFIGLADISGTNLVKLSWFFNTDGFPPLAGFIQYGGLTPVYVDIYKNRTSPSPPQVLLGTYTITNLATISYNDAYTYTETVSGTYTYTLKVTTSAGTSPGYTTNSITI